MAIRFGMHCSLKNGLKGALEEGKQAGCETVQIFTRSPRIWKMKPPSSSDIAEFKKLKKELGIDPVIVHAPYLPNLATSLKPLYEKSRRLLLEDLELSAKLDAKYLVIHPGSFSENSNVKAGIRKIAAAVNDALKACRGAAVVLLENVAGGGRRIGSSFEELRDITGLIKKKDRIGICFDTAHAFAAGYNIKTRKGVDGVIKEFDRVMGLDMLKMIHFNDSLVPFASRKDRHQHIGKGYIGLDGFKFLISRLKDKVEAGILETPKDRLNSDKNNLKTLFKLRD